MKTLNQEIFDDKTDDSWWTPPVAGTFTKWAESDDKPDELDLVFERLSKAPAVTPEDLKAMDTFKAERMRVLGLPAKFVTPAEHEVNHKARQAKMHAAVDKLFGKNPELAAAAKAVADRMLDDCKAEVKRIQGKDDAPKSVWDIPVEVQ